MLQNKRERTILHVHFIRKPARVIADRLACDPTVLEDDDVAAVERLDLD